MGLEVLSLKVLSHIYSKKEIYLLPGVVILLENLIFIGMMNCKPLMRDT